MELTPHSIINSSVITAKNAAHNPFAQPVTLLLRGSDCCRLRLRLRPPISGGPGEGGTRRLTEWQPH